MRNPNGDSWERERLLEALDDFQRGIGDAPLLRKWNETRQPETNGAGDGPMAFVLSTDEVDRHGDAIAADGWKLDSYRSNPVFLWAHDYARPVIGRAVETWVEPHRLMAQMEFAPTPFAREVAMLYQAGYQRGVSVGFKPLRYEERRHEKTGALLGIHFLEQELLEASAVPVPANRSALRRALVEAPRVAEYLRRAAPMTPFRGDATAANVAVLEAMWPQLSARVDELAKLAEELALAVQEVEQASSFSREEPKMAELLAALKNIHP